MIRLTVNLVDEAHAALTAAAEQTGDSKTDTINRALIVYATIIQVHDRGEGRGAFSIDCPLDAPVRVEVNRRRWWWSR